MANDGWRRGRTIMRRGRPEELEEAAAGEVERSGGLADGGE
jgi:hypothetical protein